MIEGEEETRYALDTFLAVEAWGEPVAGDDAAELGWFTVAEMADLPITASTLDIARRIYEGQT